MWYHQANIHEDTLTLPQEIDDLKFDFKKENKKKKTELSSFHVLMPSDGSEQYFAIKGQQEILTNCVHYNEHTGTSPGLTIGQLS